GASCVPEDGATLLGVAVAQVMASRCPAHPSSPTPSGTAGLEGSSSVYSTSASTAKCCYLRAWSCWVQKTLASKRSDCHIEGTITTRTASGDSVLAACIPCNPADAGAETAPHHEVAI